MPEIMPETLQVRVASPAGHAALYPMQDLAVQAAANLLSRYDARISAERRFEELGGSPKGERILRRAVAAEERAARLLREALRLAGTPGAKAPGLLPVGRRGGSPKPPLDPEALLPLAS